MAKMLINGALHDKPAPNDGRFVRRSGYSDHRRPDGCQLYPDIRRAEKTDGLGFSQIGYFATVCGLAAGAIIFDEPLSVSLIIAIAILFLGLAITNGHLKFPLKFPKAQS